LGRDVVGELIHLNAARSAAENDLHIRLLDLVGSFTPPEGPSYVAKILRELGDRQFESTLGTSAVDCLAKYWPVPPPAENEAYEAFVRRLWDHAVRGPEELRASRLRLLSSLGRLSVRDPACPVSVEDDTFQILLKAALEERMPDIYADVVGQLYLKLLDLLNFWNAHGEMSPRRQEIEETFTSTLIAAGGHIGDVDGAIVFYLPSTGGAPTPISVPMGIELLSLHYALQIDKVRTTEEAGVPPWYRTESESWT
jgi:hypothetical protein